MASEYISYIMTIALGLIMVIAFATVFASIAENLTVSIAYIDLLEITEETRDLIEDIATLIDSDPSLTETNFRIILPDTVARFYFTITVLSDGETLQSSCQGKETTISVKVDLPENFRLQGEFFSLYDTHSVSYVPPTTGEYVLILQDT